MLREAVFPEVLANLGAAYGTAKSGVGIANLGVRKPQEGKDICLEDHPMLP